MSMQYGITWARGEAPLSEFGQFQNRLDSHAEALAQVFEAGQSHGLTNC